jgi:hypothetical protein
MPDPVEGGACNEDAVGRPDRAGIGAVPDVAAVGEAVACYAEGS